MLNCKRFLISFFGLVLAGCGGNVDDGASAGSTGFGASSSGGGFGAGSGSTAGVGGAFPDAGAVEPVTCDDGNPCTDDTLAAGVCVGSWEAVFARPCAFGDHSGICQRGECVCDTHDDCDDGDPTTSDECADWMCLHTKPPPAQPCDYFGWTGSMYGSACCWLCANEGLEGGLCPYTDGFYAVGTCTSGMCCYDGNCQMNLCPETP